MSSYLSHRRKGFQGGVTAFNGFGNRSRSFDGVSDYVDLGDSDDFSFGDGSNDSPFSFSVWIKMENHIKFRVIGKYKDQSPDEREWLLSTDSSGRLMLFLSDNNNGGSINRRYSDTTTMASYVGQWIHVVATYDGSGSDSGIKLYINASRVDDISQSSGNYTSMVNTGEHCKIGTSTVSTGQDYAEGNIADVRIYNTDISSSDVSDIYAGTNVTTNLVGHWLTDADNVLDNAGSNNGTNYGSKYSYDNPSPPVEFGRASRYFDGVDDTINLGQTTDNAIFSVSSWFKLNTVNSNGSGIIGKWHNNTSASWLFYVRSASTSGNMTFIVRNGADNGHFILDSGVSASSLIGEWTHIVGVADGNNLTMYINGVSVASISYDGTINNPTSDAHIGSYNADINNSHRTNGNIADCRIYDTDLTASQISDLYAGTDVQTNLIGHWLTDNDDVEDKAGTNDGTNFGSTYSYDNPPMDLIPSRQASRSFDGADDRVTISPNSINGATALTVSAWIKLDSIDINQTVIGVLPGLNTNAFRLMVRDTNQIDLIWGDGSNFFVSTLDGATLGSGSWIHVAGTFNNSGNATRYVDGTQTGTIDDLSSYEQLSIINDVGIGARYFTSFPFYNSPLDGKIADVRLYDTDLTASQILDIYNGTTDRTNLIGQWLTNSDDVLDHAGTNDGTNVGSTYSTDSPS